MYQDDEPLARRAFLGLAVRREPDGSDAGKRLVVRRVVEGGAASLAGMVAGDVLDAACAWPREAMASDDASARLEPLSGVEALAAFARTVRAGERVLFAVDRGGRRELRGAVAPPKPSPTGGVELGSIVACGHRLRTVVAAPRSAGPHPAILYLQGVRPTSCEVAFAAAAPLARLVHAWTGAGFLVELFDRSGVGDSEGPGPRETGLEVELEGACAALDALVARPDVDASRVFIFGQSFGGVIAPLVVERPVAGVAVFGASARRWHELMVAAARRQREVLGRSGGARCRAFEELHRMVCRDGHRPRTAFERRPDLAVLRSADIDGETMFGRHVSLFQALDSVDLVAAWRAVGRAGVRVLALAGQCDVVASPEEASEIVDAVGEGADLAVLPGVGHDMLSYASPADALRRRGRGSQSSEMATATLRWMAGG